jgi:hypothetical protein
MEPWTAEDFRAFFNERAAIMEYDGGLLRHEAETRAQIETNAERKRQKEQG